ncbi:ciliogenesis-associated TTC17-interacting protein-like, partial [Hyla sarda]|uniref:ciliogenesis-associated TTC17-interacting protein-like n=1 Tax=Hyla sarda TaxID=327740 RepID=UPI0024C23115
MAEVVASIDDAFLNVCHIDVSVGWRHIGPHGRTHALYVMRLLLFFYKFFLDILQLRGDSLDKKTTMRRRGDRMEISRVITEGQDVRHDTKSYPLSALSGFISEASNLLVTRLLARRKGPGNLDFLTFDTEMNLCISSYRWLGSRPQLVGRDAVEVYGVERALLSDDVPITWQYYFLPDGHLANRVQVGSPVTIRILQMPMLSEP